MTEIGRLNRSAAKDNPSDVFGEPEEILTNIMMTRGEKLAALERWRDDILREMSATTEGMTTNGVSDLLSRRLTSIDATIKQLSTAQTSTSGDP